MQAAPVPSSSGEVSVQADARAIGAEDSVPTLARLSPALPVLLIPESAAAKRFEQAANDFRQLFPAALCYVKIVPVDEVVTLELFHREDDHLQRLMLDEAGKSELNRLWDELHFVSRDLLTVEDAYEQLMQFATQDGDPSVFAKLRQPIQERAQSFRDALVAAEPMHLRDVLSFASRAYRRPLSQPRADEFSTLYSTLRAEGLDHETSIRLLIARILVSTQFLYRQEAAKSGAASTPVDDYELASRLSYCLWSGPPDEELMQLAGANRLSDPQTLKAQVARMIRDSRIERMAREFGCQWLQIRDVGSLDEKSEKLFPEFAQGRQLLQRESELYWKDWMQSSRPFKELLQSDHTFLNESLAKYYGIEAIVGEQFRKVAGMSKRGRSGLITLGAVMSVQSGASRTSPILRGNWISEVLLGDKLPKPPKNVPPLPADESTETLSVRELVLRHTQDAACAHCHARIDPFGLALENFDPIGRFRTKDLAGHTIDATTTLPDGTKIDGAASLTEYLVNQKRSQVTKQFSRKILGYALGRAVQLSDLPLLQQLETQLADDDSRASFEHVMQTIVLSRQFLHIRGKDSPISNDEVQETNPSGAEK